MSINIKISMENYCESLNENNKLAYRKKITLESGETVPDPTVSEMIQLKMLMLFLKFHGKM